MTRPRAGRRSIRSSRRATAFSGLFELEKALYELRYELGNRPGWAGIPLQGIVDSGVLE